MSDRILSRPGMPTPAEASSRDALRERVSITLRPIGAPTPIGLLGLVAAAFVLSGLQLGWLDAALEDAAGHTVLPFGRRNKGKPAVHGSLPEQVGEVATEPGVRTKL